MRRAILLLGFATTFAVASPEPLATAAEYYFSRQDYRQAYQLWSEILKRQSDNLAAVFRVCELKMFFDTRGACRDLMLKFLADSGSALSSETRRHVRDKHSQLQSLFLSDDGQAHFFQAQAKASRKDYTAALSLLEASGQAEQGNVRVLWERAQMEKRLQRYERYHETLKETLANDPFHSEARAELIDSSVYFRQYDKAVALYREEPDRLTRPGSRTSIGIALLETGHDVEAQALLLSISDDVKGHGAHPVVWYGLGKILSKRADSLATASVYMERFLRAAAHPENNTVDGWDLYHTDELVQSVRKSIK